MNVRTLGELLRRRAESGTPEQGFRFLADGRELTESLSYAELDRHAQAIAARLQSVGVRPGTPVLLLYAPGLDFVRAFFGCLHAGAVAVPAYPPIPSRLARTLPRLRALVRDAKPKVALTSSGIAAALDAVLPMAPELGSCSWIATDDAPLDPSGWQPPDTGADDLALLQYTSGSTREPRGVMLTHANLLHNQQLIRAAFRQREGETYVTWLPVYHDMGLIGMLMQPLYLGGQCVMMPPLAFLQDPTTWLAAISRYRGTTSGAPNFAYELAVRKIPEGALADLDLSTWRVAYCGAEPVRKGTLERFAERFGPCGFAARALLPCYGLAEASLIVTGAARDDGIVSMSVDEGALRNGHVTPSAWGKPLVSCGPVVGDQELAIVVDGKRVDALEVGEVWVRGPSVGTGYFGCEEETTATFGARCADGSGPFLRTGDLGFVDERGELYVVGRSKDLIIVRGLNHHPNDIEATVESSWAALRPGCTAAFALDGEGSEEVAVVCEYDLRGATGQPDWEAVVGAIRSAVAESHELALRAVVLLAAGELPKTTSGKVQQSAARQTYLAGDLVLVGADSASSHAGLKMLHHWVAATPVMDVPESGSPRTADEIAAFIVSRLSRRLGRPIDPTSNFAAIGLDSFDVVTIIDELATVLGVPLSPMLAIDYPSPAQLAAYLVQDNQGG